MGLFDSKPKEKTTRKVEDGVRPEVTRMSGYDSIEDVAAKAPRSATQAGETKGAERARKSAAPAPAKKETDEEREAREKKEKAFEKVGMHLCKQIAEVPYEVWAFYANDPALQLSPEDSKELTDSYFLIAQAVAPDLSSPWVVGGLAVMQNVALIGVRLKMLAEKDALKKMRGAAELDNLVGNKPDNPAWAPPVRGPQN